MANANGPKSRSKRPRATRINKVEVKYLQFLPMHEVKAPLRLNQCAKPPLGSTDTVSSGSHKRRKNEICTRIEPHRHRSWLRKANKSFPFQLLVLLLFNSYVCNGFVNIKVNNELPICKVHDSLNPDLIHNTGSYGNIFKLKSKAYPVTITQLAFKTDLLTNVTYHAWTKTGTYKEFTTDEGSWTKIAEGETTGRGRVTSTPIPKESFSQVQLEPHSTQSFVVVLETADIRYNYGIIEDNVLEENEDLTIYEGIGVAQFPPFQDNGTFFSPRLFAGSVEFLTEKPCDNPSTVPTSAPTTSPTVSPTLLPITGSPTALASSRPTVHSYVATVEYAFLLEVSLNEIDFITIEMDDVTKSTLQEVFDEEGNTHLHEIFDKGDLKFEGVTSTADVNSKDFECDLVDPEKVCAVIESKVEISHNSKVSNLEIRYALLPFSDIIYNKLTFVDKKYIGPKPVSAMKTVQFTGIRYEDLENEDTVSTLELAVREFLDSVQDQADIATVKVVGKNKVERDNTEYMVRRLLSGDGSVLRARAHTEPDTASVDVTIAITGEYQPPPELDLGHLCEESFDNNGDSFVEMIHSTGNADLQRIVKIENVETDEPDEPDELPVTDDNVTIAVPEEEKTDINSKKVPTIPIVVALVAVSIVVILVVVLRGKQKIANSSAPKDTSRDRRSSLHSLLNSQIHTSARLSLARFSE